MAKKPTNPAKPYTVGYCKPPLHSRFPPGHSGNDKGRPPKARAELPPGLDPIHAATLTVMGEQVTPPRGGGRRKVKALEAVMRTLRDQAISGDMRATRLLLQCHAEAQAEAAKLQARSAANQELGDAVFIAVDVMRECKRLGGLDDAALAEEVRRAALAAEVRKREAASAAARGEVNASAGAAPPPATPAGGAAQVGREAQSQGRPTPSPMPAADAAAREPDPRLGRRAQPHPGEPTPTPAPTPAPAPTRVEAAPAPPDPPAPPAPPAAAAWDPAPARPRGPAPRRGRGDPLIPSRGPLILDGYGVGGGRQRTPGGGTFS